MKKQASTNSTPSKKEARVYRALRKPGGPFDDVLKKLAGGKTINDRDVQTVMPIIMFSAFLITIASGGVGYMLGSYHQPSMVVAPAPTGGQYSWWVNYLENATPAPAETPAETATVPVVEPASATAEITPAETKTELAALAKTPMPQVAPEPVVKPGFKFDQVSYKSEEKHGHFKFALAVTGDKAIAGKVWAMAVVVAADGQRRLVAPVASGSEAQPLTFKARRFTEKSVRIPLAAGEAIEKIAVTVAEDKRDQPVRKVFRVRKPRRQDATVATGQQQKPAL